MELIEETHSERADPLSPLSASRYTRYHSQKLRWSFTESLASFKICMTSKLLLIVMGREQSEVNKPTHTL
jgi:hypothetical protein